MDKNKQNMKEQNELRDEASCCLCNRAVQVTRGALTTTDPHETLRVICGACEIALAPAQRERMNKKEQEAAEAVLEIVKRATPENVIAGCHAYNNLMEGVGHRMKAEDDNGQIR